MPDVRRALRSIDAGAYLSFAQTPRELRSRILEQPLEMGAIVGPLGNALSPLNIAAALARDGMANEVVLVVPTLTRDLSERARRAGIGTVVDLSTLPVKATPPGMKDLDEPLVSDDDVPTMVWDMKTSRAIREAHIPRIEAAGRPRLGRPDGIAAGVSTMAGLAVTTDGPAAVGLAETANGSAAVGPTVTGGPSSAGPAAKERQPEDSSDLLTLPLLREGKHGPELDQVRVPRASIERRDGKPTSFEIPRRATERTLPAAPIITFVSGRGGVGKTSLVAVMSTIAASWGVRVAACDLDLSCGNLCGLLGVRHAVDLAESIGDAHVTDEEVLAAATRVSQNLELWGPCAKPEMAEVVYPQVERLLNVLSSRFDLVLVDSSTTITDAVAQAVQQCDRLVITVDGRLGSASSQARVASFAVRLGVARTRMVRLANRCGPHGKGEPAINRADVGLETARPLRVMDGGAEVSDCLADGRPSDLVDLGSRFAESSATALAMLLSELGRLPACDEAQQALRDAQERPRWSFGRRREAL